MLTLIPPPAEPRDGQGDWSVPEAEFGVVFPEQFKELVRSSGTGYFGMGFLDLYTPLTPSGRTRMRDHIQTMCELRDALELSLIVHPEQPGLLPWGGDSNGHIYWWWTEGPPESWSIAQFAHDEEDDPHRADVPIATFLVNYARNQYPEMLGGLTYDESHLHFKSSES
ncbi:MAG: SMI1/KNR4 family protein [Planctomycetaceae bacterium]